ncbi:unnamed protein product [Oppiella nova]|uniref:WD repeat-containing protein 18 n=1 Tax=Oppiella nova TaxID=334625 RepID=A0A7R9MCM9_9ACAR|nr:unnamed protein product [Oppiella nova]CAG2174906.1 unnamed protein product [Oppiella nova]
MPWIVSKQVVISSDLNAELHSVCVSDLVSGNTLTTFKSVGCVERHCLDLVKDQLMISSVKESPVINVWSFERKDQLHLKIICPNKVTALKTTNDGKYCVVAINTSLYIWQTSSGELMAILEKHYQKITCIAITSDDSLIVSGGDDGLAFVWSLGHSIGYNEFDVNDSISSQREPLFKWSDHTMAITDVHIGLGGIEAYCMTCSTDQTCRIYELVSGVLMITIVFDTPLWAVAMDSTQSHLFVGGHDSNIYETKLYEKPSNCSQKQNKPQFIGHESAVTCLAVSMDGMALISGPISNLLVTPFPSALFDQKSPNIVIKPFKRTIINDIYNEDPDNSYCIEIINDRCLTNSLEFMKGLDLNDDTGAANDFDIFSANDENEDIRRELSELKEVNSQLYNYSVDAIFKTIP